MAWFSQIMAWCITIFSLAYTGMAIHGFVRQQKAKRWPVLFSGFVTFIMGMFFLIVTNGGYHDFLIRTAHFRPIILILLATLIALQWTRDT